MNNSGWLKGHKHTWYVSESFCDTVVFIEDDAWSFALDTSAVSHFTLAGTHALRGINLLGGSMNNETDC